MMLCAWPADGNTDVQSFSLYPIAAFIILYLYKAVIIIFFFFSVIDRLLSISHLSRFNQGDTQHERGAV